MNYNSDITIRELSRHDLYDGIIVQSFGNTDCIYKLNFIDGSLYYTTIARRETKQDPFIQVLCGPCRYTPLMIRNGITTNSIDFDKITQRDSAGDS